MDTVFNGVHCNACAECPYWSAEKAMIDYESSGHSGYSIEILASNSHIRTAKATVKVRPQRWIHLK